MDGVKVGSFVKGKSHNTEVTGRACSHLLRTNLPSYIKSLADAFSKIGVKDTEKYIVPVPSDPYPSIGGSPMSFYKSMC